MLFRKKPTLPEVTNDSFSRWLRAQRPPFDWFMGQVELIQEQLAILGDEYVMSIAEAAGAAAPSKGEDVSVRELAAEAAARILNRDTPPPASRGSARLFGREADATHEPPDTPAQEVAS